MNAPPHDERELAFSSAVDLAAWIRQRRLRARRVTEIFLGRIERWNPQLKAFLYVNREGALRRADELDRAADQGHWLGPLHGLPLALKDDAQTADMPTTYGSRLLDGWRPAADADAVGRLRAAGAIFLGKTNLDEFALGVSTRNLLAGQTLNPYDATRIPGGSSGGSAVAVSCGLAPSALGSDSAGSIRLPSAACGILGLKPGVGRISTYGLTAILTTKAVIGTLTRNARDSALLMNVLSGIAPRDPLTAESPRWRTPKFPGPNLTGVRFGYLEELSWHCDPAIKKGMDTAISAIRQAGGKVETVPETEEEEIVTAAALINQVEFLALIDRRLRSALPEIDPREARKKMDPVVQAYLDQFDRAQATDYCRALHVTRPRLLVYYREILRRHDFLLLPPSGKVPLLVADAQIREDGFSGLSDRLRDYRSPCELASTLGFPSVAVPAGMFAGLPNSVQLVADLHGEARLLQTAACLQSLFAAPPRPKLS